MTEKEVVVVPPTPSATAEGGGARWSSPVWLGVGGGREGRGGDQEKLRGQVGNGVMEDGKVLPH